MINLYSNSIDFISFFFFGFPRRTENESFFYEELAKVQKIDMDKREKEMSKNDMIQATAKKTEEEAKKR